MKKGKLLTEPKVKDLVKRWYDDLCAFSYAVISNGMGVHGIPDRVGCVEVVITPEMVGKTFGLFVAIECKGEGRRGEKDRGCTKNQVDRLNEIAAAGGVALVCDGEEDLRSLEWIRSISRTRYKKNDSQDSLLTFGVENQKRSP